MTEMPGQFSSVLNNAASVTLTFEDDSQKGPFSETRVPLEAAPALGLKGVVLLFGNY